MASDPKFKEAKETDAKQRQRCQAFTQLLVNYWTSSSQSEELVLLAKAAKSLRHFMNVDSPSPPLPSPESPHFHPTPFSSAHPIPQTWHSWQSWKWWWPGILFWCGGLVASLICFLTQFRCVLLTAPVNLKLFKNRSCASLCSDAPRGAPCFTHSGCPRVVANWWV